MDVLTYESMLNLMTLTGLEIVLGVDNVIFIALLVQKLERYQRLKARIIGLSLALILRILMLFCATWIMSLTKPLFSIFSFPVSGRSLLLIIGGLFLIIKSGIELFEMISHKHEEKHVDAGNRFFKVISQIIFIDIILSFDSIITAVGISDNFPIMVIAIVIAMLIMLVGAGPISNFIYANPSIKVQALAFIALVGAILTLDGINIEISKAYLYFAMGFSVLVEWVNMRVRKKA